MRNFGAVAYGFFSRTPSIDADGIAMSRYDALRHAPAATAIRYQTSRQHRSLQFRCDEGVIGLQGSHIDIVL